MKMYYGSFFAFIIFSMCFFNPCTKAQPIDTLDYSNRIIKESLGWAFWSRESNQSPSCIDLVPAIDPLSPEIRSTGISFNKPVLFNESCFDSIANFRSTIFRSAVYFNNAVFKSKADFTRAIFLSTVSFYGSTFNSELDFSFSNFNSSEILDFRWSVFKNRALFYKTVLPHKIDFRNTKEIAEEIDLTYTKLSSNGRKCKIALAGADISKLKLNMDLFELWFPPDTTYNYPKDEYGSHIKTVLSIDSLSFDQQTGIYKSVLKKLKDDGFDESYQILDIEYKKKKNRHDGWFSWQILDTADDLFWNYRYSPLQAILCTLVLWLIFSVIMLPYYPKMQNWVYKIGFLEKEGTKRIGLLIRSFAYTGVVFFGLKIDISKFKTRVVRNHPWLFSYLMFVYVVGVICLVLIVNVVFK